jgi:hypothetical protein
MRDITEDEVRAAFAEKTFSRGQSYFLNEYVLTAAKKGDKLTGTVLGSAPIPYTVHIEITDKIYSQCSCPVKRMCKHGVAVLLQWIHDKDSCVDADHFLRDLRKKNKEELIEIIDSLLEINPALASEIRSTEISTKKANIEAISQKLKYVARGVLDYYAVPGVVYELEEIKEMGDSLADNGNVTDALKVYLLLIEWGVDAFLAGVDDSDGIFGEIIIECVEDFNKNAQKLEEKKRRNLIYRILDIIESEDFGLETELLLCGVATKENVSSIEEELLKKIPAASDEIHGEYHRERILDLLVHLYEGLDMTEDVLRVIKAAKFKYTEDYVRMARALIKQGQHKKAFAYVEEGRGVEGEMDFRLNTLYFELLQNMKGVKVDVEEVLTVGLQLLSSRFNSKRYSMIVEVFKNMGEHEKLLLGIKAVCEENVVLEVLLHENYITEAIEYALSSSELYSSQLVKVAEIAQKQNKKAAITLISRALKGFSQPYLSAELIEFFVKESDESELKRALNCIRSDSMAKKIMPALLKRNQGYAVTILKKFIDDIKKDDLKGYAAELKNEYAKEIYGIWVSKFINRSHIYYDDSIDLLREIKGMVSTEEWEKYISVLMRRNSGKKKFLEKIRKAGLV